MKSPRRQFVIYLIFIGGLIAGLMLGKSEPGFILAIGFALLLLWFMNWDEARYQQFVKKSQSK